MKGNAIGIKKSKAGEPYKEWRILASISGCIAGMASGLFFFTIPFFILLVEIRIASLVTALFFGCVWIYSSGMARIIKEACEDGSYYLFQKESD